MKTISWATVGPAKALDFKRLKVGYLYSQICRKRRCLIYTDYLITSMRLC